MKRGLFLAVFVSFAVLLLAIPAYADKCKDPIVDEINILDASSKARLENAMSVLANTGADVRVMFLSSYHRNASGEMNKSLAEYRDYMLAKCRSWQAADGGFKNNFILLVVVPKKKTSVVYYGKQWSPMLAPGESRYNSDMTARFRDGDIVGGVLMGLTDITDLISIKPSQAGKPVVINHPTDYSGLWSVFKWILLLGAIGLLGFLGYWIWNQFEKRRAAQRDAKTERDRCTQALNSFDGPYAVLRSKLTQATFSDEWKMHIGHLLDIAKNFQHEASAFFSSLNRSTNNPDASQLSITEYEAMKTRYAGAARLFENAQRKLGEAEEAFRHAERGEKVPSLTSTVFTTPPQSDIPSSGAERHSDVRTPSRDTTVIIDQRERIIERERVVERPQYEDRWVNERRADPDKPVIADEPSRSGGQEVSWGQSGRGDGTAETWGTSGSGGGRESSWDSAEASSSSDRSGTSY